MCVNESMLIVNIIVLYCNGWLLEERKPIN